MAGLYLSSSRRGFKFSKDLAGGQRKLMHDTLMGPKDTGRQPWYNKTQ